MNFSSDDPKIFGPEKWEVGHSLSIKAKSKVDAEHFINKTWRRIVDDIRCHHCREDATKYLNSHPFVYKDELSAFRYLYDMHQFVNAKLGKHGITFDAAYQKYNIDISERPCSAACADSDSTKNNTLLRNYSVQGQNTLPSITLLNLSSKTPPTVTVKSLSKDTRQKVPIKFSRH